MIGGVLTLALPLLTLVIIVVVVVLIIKRSAGGREDATAGGDIVSYLVLALAMGVAGFALAGLARAAFPAGRIVFNQADEVANSIAALVVSTPFLLYFWQRQAKRRVLHPASAGWTVYLFLIEFLFMTAFVVTAVMFLNGLFGEVSASAWTGALVFGGILVFHEYAARVAPPLTEAGELPRVIGSAISLTTATIGLAGVLAGLFEVVFGTGPSLGFRPWLAMLVVGAPIWWYRWLRPWDSEPAVPRTTWTVIVSIGSLATALGGATAVVVMVAQFLLTETPSAGLHFETLPVALALLVAGLGVWAVHRRTLGRERSTAVQFYEYAMAAIGLATAVAFASTLTIVAFSRSLIVGGTAADVVTFAIVLLAALMVWLWFDVRNRVEPSPSPSWPRRLYTLGFGAVFGLISAGALIAFLFTLLRRLLVGGVTGSLLEPGIIFAYSGLAASYLLRAFARERVAKPDTSAVAPFAVTIICSHPGVIASKFGEQARLRVVYRGDDAGVIDDGMADEIVAAVANRPALVWVDETGFKIAPMRT